MWHSGQDELGSASSVRTPDEVMVDKVQSSLRRTYIPVDGATHMDVVHLLSGHHKGMVLGPDIKRPAILAATESDEAYFRRRSCE